MSLCLNIVFHEYAELLVVAHQRAADATSVFYASPAQLAQRISEVGHALRVALDVALFGGLTDAEDDLPPPRSALRLRHVSHSKVHTQSISSVCPYHAHYPPCQAECRSVWAYHYSVLRGAVSAQDYRSVAYLHFFFPCKFINLFQTDRDNFGHVRFQDWTCPISKLDVSD